MQPKHEGQDGAQRDPHDRGRAKGRDSGTMQGRRLAGRQGVRPSGRDRGPVIKSPDGEASLAYRVQHGKAMGPVRVESAIVEV